MLALLIDENLNRRVIEDLVLLVECATADEVQSLVIYLPL
jgi:hypothetical protein